MHSAATAWPPPSTTATAATACLPSGTQPPSVSQGDEDEHCRYCHINSGAHRAGGAEGLGDALHMQALALAAQGGASSSDLMRRGSLRAGEAAGLFLEPGRRNPSDTFPRTSLDSICEAAAAPDGQQPMDLQHAPRASFESTGTFARHSSDGLSDTPGFLLQLLSVCRSPFGIACKLTNCWARQQA